MVHLWLVWSLEDGHTSSFHFGHLKMILLWVFANICVWTQASISQAAMSADLGYIRRNRHAALQSRGPFPPPPHCAVKGALCVLPSTSCHPQQFLHHLWCEGLPSVSLIYISSMTNDRDLFLHPQALYISVSKISPTLMLIFIVWSRWVRVFFML